MLAGRAPKLNGAANAAPFVPGGGAGGGMSSKGSFSFSANAFPTSFVPGTAPKTLPPLSKMPGIRTTAQHRRYALSLFSSSGSRPRGLGLLLIYQFLTQRLP